MRSDNIISGLAPVPIWRTGEGWKKVVGCAASPQRNTAFHPCEPARIASMGPVKLQ